MDFYKKYHTEAYEPYYHPRTNMIRKFKPDFIFWMKSKNDYFIIFVDPKGMGRTEYEHKVDGFTRIFCEANSPKTFNSDGDQIKIYLLLFTEDRNFSSKGYEKYWFDHPSTIFKVSGQ